MSAANVFNLGADIGAMGSSVALLIPGTARLFTVAFGLTSLLTVLVISYTAYAKYLKWMTVSLFAYIAVAFVIHVPWRTVLDATLIPRFGLKQESFVALVAVLGTTISPYLFFW
jgi:Mn2+/Fe2+ NRAMP family transporter